MDYKLTQLTYRDLEYIGLHNEFSSWGKVLNIYGDLVEELYTEEDVEGCYPNFTVSDFIAAGYTIVGQNVRIETEEEVF